MEGNRTPNRNPNRNYQNLRPPPIQTNFTNTEVQPLRRTRRRLNCQAGSDRDVYELIPIKFVPKIGGRKKQKGRGLRFSKTKKLHNSPKHNFLVHTLTGKKKNIESQKKSMKKAKKVLGVNK